MRMESKRKPSFANISSAPSAQARRSGSFGQVAPRGDAWCSACEEVRVREGGSTGDWNERSEAFAGIKLLCGACYDRLRAQHGI